MARYVVFWGHGRWSPNENPGKTIVPTGCKLLLFARHKEMIDVRRMHDIIGSLERFEPEIISPLLKNTIQSQAMAAEGDASFMYWMKRTASLRRIKNTGEDVHNYRLYPYDRHMGTHPSIDGYYEVVTTDNADGISLVQLMAKYGQPGVTMLWMPCRQVTGLAPKNALVDAYDSQDQIGKALGDGMGYYRNTNYFKHRLHGTRILPEPNRPEEREFIPGRVSKARKPPQ